MTEKRNQLNVRNLRPEAKKKMKAYAVAQEMDLNDLVLEGLQMVCNNRGIRTIVRAD